MSQRTKTILFNLVASTVLVMVSGIAMCFQVAFGETVEPVMAFCWWAVWLLSMLTGVAAAFDAIDNQEAEREAWLQQMVGPILNQEARV